jgi:hypothetical protein
MMARVPATRLSTGGTDVGLVFRKRLSLGKGANLNLSKTGASVSTRAGRVTVSSRGRVSVRILPGITWRGKL